MSADVFEQLHDESVKRQNQKKAMKKRAKKARSMSESYCDELKVINEMDAHESAKEEKRSKSNGRKGSGKKRNMSESSDDDNIGDMPSQNHFKYKSILKNRNSLSECNEMSSADDHHHGGRNFYSMSADFGICESHDSLSESCKKTVRFSDTIKKQLFR